MTRLITNLSEVDAQTKIKREIKAQMARYGISKRQLAETLEITEPGLSNILSGSKGIITKNLEQILDALGLELIVQPKSDDK